MSIAEEQKILKKVEISLKQHSAAGLNISVQKLNQLKILKVQIRLQLLAL